MKLTLAQIKENVKAAYPLDVFGDHLTQGYAERNKKRYAALIDEQPSIEDLVEAIVDFFGFDGPDAYEFVLNACLKSETNHENP